MHVANLNPAEVSEAAYRRFDVAIRQGTAGGRPAQESDRQGTEVGLSPMAYIRLSGRNGCGCRRRGPTCAGSVVTTPISPTSPWVRCRVAPGTTRLRSITTLETRGCSSRLGVAVYRKAKAQGLGRELPTAWFVQDIRD
jgi:alanine dehydrogenase